MTSATYMQASSIMPPEAEAAKLRPAE
jgi:hypothetical protein